MKVPTFIHQITAQKLPSAHHLLLSHARLKESHAHSQLSRTRLIVKDI